MAIIRGLLIVALAAAPTASRAEALRFEVDAGTIRALRDGAPVWQNTHDRRGQFARADAPGHLIGPVQVDDLVYYAVGGSVFQVEAETGVVRTRVLLPGHCKALRPDRDGVVLDVGSGSSQSWTRQYRLGREGHDVPFFLSADLRAARMARSDAEDTLDAVLQADPTAPRVARDDAGWRRRPELAPHLEAAVTMLEALAKRDPTNPWYHYWRGEYLADLGRQREAAAAFGSALEGDPAYDFELMPMVVRLDDVAPQLGQQAFERAMRFLIAHGYEPESMLALVSVLVHYGRPGGGGALDPARDLERVSRVAERISEFAPYCEGAAFMYKGVADANRAAGRQQEAAHWDEWSVAALPSRAFGAPSRRAGWAGPALNVLIAAVLALFVGTLVRGLRYLPMQQRASGMARWNPFCSWTRGEIVGLLLVFAALAWASAAAYVSLFSIARGAAFPLAALSGNLGHPDSVEYLARYQGTPAGDFVHALALQRAGELDRAATLYERLGTPRARNNLGVIHQLRGDTQRARTLFAEARNGDPGLAEATYNLGEAVESPRLERLQRYGFEGAVFALPGPDTWSDVLAPPRWFGNPFQFFETMQSISQASPATRPRTASLVEPRHLLVVALALVAVLALLGLWVRAPQVRSAGGSWLSRAGWALGFAIPGTARQLGFTGPPLLVLFTFALLVRRFLAASQGVASDVVEAVGMTNLSNVFGVVGLSLTPLQQASRAVGELWWLIWLVNLVAVVVLERRSPDPLGPRGQP